MCADMCCKDDVKQYLVAFGDMNFIICIFILMFEVKMFYDEDENVDNVQTVTTHYLFSFPKNHLRPRYQFLLLDTLIFFAPRNGTSAASPWRTA